MPMEPIIACQTGWMGQRTDGLVTSCQEQETKSILEDARDACTGYIKDHLTLMPDL